MNIFLTGATGFVGAKLVQNLIQADMTLYLLYRDEHKKNKLLEKLKGFEEKIHFVYGDITSDNCGITPDVLATLPQMDYFYHIAALVKFDEDLREQLFNINLEGTRHALSLAGLLNTKHFLYVSTAYTVGVHEYAKEALHPLDTPVNNPYEESKLQAEHLVMDTAHSSNMKASILRPAIIIGDSVTGEADSKFTLYGFMKALKVFKRKMLRSENDTVYRLFADDNCTSNLVPVDYVVRVLTHAVQHAEDQKIYHITNNHPPRNLDILSMIKHHLDFNQIDVAPIKDKTTMTDEEAVLNGYIDVFAPYFKKSIVFEENNTVHLLSHVNESTLQLSHDQLDHIIEVYFRN